MKSKGKQTLIVYQVETSRGVHENDAGSLKSATALCKDLVARGCAGVQLCRCDRSGVSNYYEVIKVFN